METIKKPIFKLLYNTRDITNDIGKNLISLSYTDNDSKHSDEIDINLEDTEELWRNSWYPGKGDTIQLSIGYDDDDILIDCGTFEIDEINISGPPDTISIKAVAAGIKKALRTHNSKSYESQTLKQIAKYVADKNGLTLIGTIGNIKFDRQTQYRETDLAFLKRVSEEYGYIFSIRDKKLIFTSVFDIENGKVVVEIDRTDLKSYSLKDKALGTYQQANVKYHNPVDKTVNSSNVKTLSNKDNVTYKQIATNDSLEIRTKAESPAQAELKAKAALHYKNSKQQEGNIITQGNPILVAGNNFLLTGLGLLSGKYYISKSVHTIQKGDGYDTSIEIKRIQVTTDSKKSSKAVGKPPAYEVVTLTNKDNVSFKQIQ